MECKISVEKTETFDIAEEGKGDSSGVNPTKILKLKANHELCLN